MVQIPGLGVLNKSVNTNDVLVGAALGFIGTGAVKYLGNKFLADKAPAFLLKASPLVGGLITGGALYALQQKKNKSRATAHLFGAIVAGASVQVWDILKTEMPSYFGDVVSLNLSNYGSVIVDEATPRVGPGGYSGLIVDEPGRAMSDYNLSQLANVSMGDEESGIEEMMEMD